MFCIFIIIVITIIIISSIRFFLCCLIKLTLSQPTSFPFCPFLISILLGVKRRDE